MSLRRPSATIASSRRDSGTRFRAEVRSALPRIRAWPLFFPCERGDIRRLTLTRFPYKLLYSIEVDHIYLITVAHQHREPNYWIDRVGPA